MSPRILQRKTPPHTAAAPTRGLKAPRPFADPASRPETAEAPDPDFEARIERAARYGHRLEGIAFPAERPFPPGGPVVQRMKRKKTNDDGNQNKKQKTTNQKIPSFKNQKITDFFKKTDENQQQLIQIPLTDTTPNLVSNTSSDLDSVSDLVSTTNSTLTSQSNLVLETSKEEISTLPKIKEQEKPQPFSFSELQKQQTQKKLTRIKKTHPYLENVPDDWIRLGAHNPKGPEITLRPPIHSGPAKETQALLKDHPYHHIVDLSTGSFQIYQGKDKEPLTYRIDREGEDADATMSDVRNYAMLTNAYLSTVGPQTVQDTKRKEKGSIGSIASEIATKERKKHQGVYGEKIVGHVPDSSISGLSHSPMGFLPMTKDANSIVGNASGIGLKRGKPIGVILVKEKGGQYHHYSLPSSTNKVSNNQTTDTSNDNSNLNFDEFQDEFQYDEETELLFQKVEEEYDNKKKTDNDNSNLNFDEFQYDEETELLFQKAEEEYNKKIEKKQNDDNEDL